MKFKLLLVVMLTSFVFTSVQAQTIKDNKYNKLIKKEKYADALNYIKDRDFPTRSYWFSNWAQNLVTYALDKNFTDDMYDIIITLANNSYANTDYPDRPTSSVAYCYLTKPFHFMWTGDFEKAEVAYKDALARLEKYKEEKNINPKYINSMKRQIIYSFYSQLEFHKLYKKLTTMDVNSLPFSEQELYQLKEEIQTMKFNYNKPRKVHQYSSASNDYRIKSANEKLASVWLVEYQQNRRIKEFFYKMSSENRKKFFPNINVYYLFGDNFLTKEQEDQNTQKRKQALIAKYGKKFGESIFKRKIMIGMTQKMLEDEFNAPRAKDSFSEYNEYWTWSNLMVAIDKKTKKVTSITNLR
ncbi:hypothetical protein [uncultured Kordia sp.]|uniref:hypothetical protein n=1 Tax=uncultured Kordia sp. TaxID=507699 RepID=UPI0026237F3C|nr:hypothetical protein [uncultured Kordia sp.]